ncbi:MAG: RNA-directed DNA polymerase [Patescibacteria group bacterium]|nr:RNA-directed DNA polymerase [Patescibacteria group bacterium]
MIKISSAIRERVKPSLDVFSFQNLLTAYYLQTDISAFFMSLKKDILYNIIKLHTKHPEILWLARQIIFQDPTKNFYQKGDPKLFRLILPHKSLFKIPENQGLPIGNLTSQFFANVYLNELDQFAKHQLKIKYYLRYVDDILILHQNPKQLKLWGQKLDQFLKEKLKLHFHPQKSILQPIYGGANFIGFIIKPHYSLVRRRTVGNLKRKLWEFNQTPLPETAEIFNEQLQQILAVINSYYGQFKHAHTFNLRKSIYQKHFGVLKSYLKPADQNFNHFIILSPLSAITNKEKLNEAKSSFVIIAKGTNARNESHRYQSYHRSPCGRRSSTPSKRREYHRTA